MSSIASFRSTALSPASLLALTALAAGAALVPQVARAADTRADRDDVAQEVRLVVRLRASPQAFAASGRERTLATLQRAGRLAQTAAGSRYQPLKLLSSGAAVLQGTQRMTLAQARADALALEAQDGVLSAEPDARVHPTSNDTYFGSQWSLFGPTDGYAGGANVTPAWATTTGSGQVVAVLDTGSTAHPDLSGQWVAGYDFVTDSTIGGDGGGRDSDPTDPGDTCNGSASSWHGTAVASTIAALTDNAYGIAGVAPGVKIMPVRVLGRCGGWLSDTADALYWLSGQGVSGVPAAGVVPRVANLSLGGRTTCYQYMQDAVNAATSAGIAVVVAAGNDGSGIVSAPANCSNAIAVAASTASGDLTTYSNYGAPVVITAPGGGNCRTQKGSACLSQLTLASAVDGATTMTGYSEMRTLAGTSFAAPNVAGVVAMMIAARPGLTPAQIRSALISSARPAVKSTFCTTKGRCGGGLLDAQRALAFVAQNTYASVALGSGITLGTAGSAQEGLIGRSKVGALKGTATGAGTLSYSWTQVSGPAATIVGKSTLPTLSFRTGTTAGLMQFALTVTSGNGYTATQTRAVRVNDAPVVPLTLPQGAAGVAYAAQLPATDADGDAVAYTLAANTAGWSLSGIGELTNAAPKQGTHRVTITARDAFGLKTIATRSITVVATAAAGNPSASLAAPGVPGGTLTATHGVAYYGTLGVTASAANGNLRYAATGLPAGATLSSAGLLSWPAPSGGPYSIAVTVTDAAGRTGTGTYGLVVRSTPAPAVAGDAAAGRRSGAGDAASSTLHVRMQ